MKIKSKFDIVPFFIFFCFAIPLFAQSADSLVADSLATDSLKIEKYSVVPNLTEEEFRFNQADFFPLSLAQKGRLSASAFRGMPPGFFEQSFEGNNLDNPLTGFWNEQWTPHWRIRQRHITKFGEGEELSSLPPGGYKPETDIVYFQTNLNYLDIDFSEYFSKNNYIRLSGNNFLRTGPYPFGFSSIHVNTYQAQVHLRLMDRWDVDVFYWQMRHHFNMIPENIFSSTRDRFRQIGHAAWLRLSGKLSERDSIIFIPNFNAVDDDYWKERPQLRDIEYKWSEGELNYYRILPRGFIGARLSSRYTSSNGKINWFDRKEGEGRALLIGKYQSGNFDLDFQIGGYKHSEIGEKLQAALHAGIHFNNSGSAGVRLFLKPQTVPLSWRTIQYDSIPAYSEKELIEKQGASIYAQKHLADWFLVRVEPFAYRTKNYPIFNNQWMAQTFENYGLHLLGGLKLWRFDLQNDFTYNKNYEEAYAPEVNNVSTIRTQLSLFKGALKLEGIFVWHVLSYYRVLEFNRMLQQYRNTQTQSGPFYLSDFKLQAHISRFTLFLVWENLLSEDYAIVEGTLTQFRTFRFGLHWLLFD